MAWTEEEIKMVLSSPLGNTGKWSNRKIIFRMLQEMAKRQTPDERDVLRTFHSNGIGFNAFDAEFLTDVANSSKEFGSLTSKQAQAVAKRLKKYVYQLTEISAANGKECPVKPIPVQPLLPLSPRPDFKPISKIDRRHSAATGNRKVRQ